MKKIIKIATRPSLLATTQTQWVVDRLQKLNPDFDFEIVKFSTHGDKDVKTSLTSFGNNTGLFVKELENALLNGDADIAVHSLKDVPNLQPMRLHLSSFPTREMPNDLLITRDNCTIEQLPQNAIIGTGSPRRILQLALLRPDLQFKEIRGNIETRIRKMQNGEYDAIILAAAGMNRLKIDFAQNSILDTKKMIPAIGQGILALETRIDDDLSNKIALSVNDEVTYKAMLAERIFMKTIEGGCKFPMAAFAKMIGKVLTMQAIVGDLQSRKFIRKSIDLPTENFENLVINFANQLKLAAEQAEINLYK